MTDEIPEPSYTLTRDEVLVVLWALRQVRGWPEHLDFDDSLAAIRAREDLANRLSHEVGA